jgi:diguanylate cyclase (GGDEF)-like protein
MDASSLLTEEPDPRRGLCRAARALLGADLAALWERRPDGYVEATASTQVHQAAGGVLLPAVPADNDVAAVMAGGVTRVVLDARHEPLGLASLVAQPLLRMGTAVGVLVVGWREPRAEVEPEALDRLDLLAAAGGLTLQAVQRAARLERLALTDPLTGLPNRRHLETHLERELARAGRRGVGLAVAVLDLDGLKAVNDTEGHDAGDRLLRETTTAWRTHLRAGDLLARVGGDEFVLVLPDCGDLATCQGTVDRVRQAGAAASAGVAVWNGDEHAASLLRRADAALYEAKRCGGLRTLVAAV